MLVLLVLLLWQQRWGLLLRLLLLMLVLVGLSLLVLCASYLKNDGRLRIGFDRRSRWCRKGRRSVRMATSRWTIDRGRGWQ